MTKIFLLFSVLSVVGCKSKAPTPAAPPESPQPAAAAVEPTAATEAPGSGADSQLVARGAYIADAAGCAVCHTAVGPKGPDLAHAYAGGFEMPDVFGTWRSPNITQDKKTGIGSWTDEQIARAIREGVRPDGTQMYSIMPYLSYNRMTDRDVKALVAFLRTVKPVERTIPPNKDLKLGKIPAPPPSNGPDVTTDPVKHGEYMASLMLCSHCHWTPNKAFQPAGPDKMYSGGLPFNLPMLGTGTLYTPNITSDKATGIGTWTEAQIFTTLKTMTRPDGRRIQGPMLFMQSGWSQLKDSDLEAVAAYIHQLPPVKHKVPASTFKPNPPGAAPAGAPDKATPPPAKAG
ncbi:MAG TPA: cytochrome c [Thermomicrobiales bacterium]|nr:cytochrome c [Thermomicrobiales bacterium]